MQKYLKVKFSIPGFHSWKDAPIQYSYLKNLHRHVFYWTITIPVIKDRQIEFIDLKSKIQTILHGYFNMLNGSVLINTNSLEFQEKYELSTHLHLGNMSCEEIAGITYEWIKQDLNIECSSVEVSEDNENSALLEF